MKLENINIMSNLSTNDVEFNLQQVLLLTTHLTKWLIRSGVGYKDFSAALKPIFYEEALKELERLGKKDTISAISLLSGLHRKDITAFSHAANEGKFIRETGLSESLSIPARVVSLWVAEEWPEKIPFYSLKQKSFVQLVHQISLEIHPRSVLNELVRLGIVILEKKQVILQKKSFIPDQSPQELRKLFTQNLQSHMKAGLNNIFSLDKKSFLEESIRADELTEQSVKILSDFSIDLWEKYSNEILKLALERSVLDQDESNADQIFCIGIYQSDL